MPSVLLLTDRPPFEARWRSACTARGLTVESRSASMFAGAVAHYPCVIFDAESATFSGDVLITAVGMARAHGAIAAVALPTGAALDDVLCDLCGTAIARSDADVERVARVLQRSSEERDPRFSYVAAAPESDRLLAIFEDGTARLLGRPLSDHDDGQPLKQAQIASDGRSVIITLGDERQLVLSAEQARHRQAAENAAGAASGALGDVDGVRLGQRLRALRLAAGLTQAELARRTGIHRPNIARVEAGRHTPSLETLARLAAAIGISTTRVLAD